MSTGTFHGVIYNARSNPRVGDMVHTRVAGGKVYCSTDYCYASGTDLDAGSVMYVGKLPKGALVLYSIVYPIDVDSNGAPDAMTNAVTGTLGIAGDADLFGSVSPLNIANPQMVIPRPDGAIYENPADLALKAEEDVIFTTASQALTATEGVCVKIFYTIV